MKSHMKGCLKAEEGTSWWSVVKTLELSLQGTQVQSLAGDLRSLYAMWCVKINKSWGFDFAETLEVFVTFHFKPKRHISMI